MKNLCTYKIIKKIAAFLAMSLFIFALTGCGNSELGNINSGSKEAQNTSFSDNTDKQEASENLGNSGGSDTSGGKAEISNSTKDTSAENDDNVSTTETQSTETTTGETISREESSNTSAPPKLSLEVIEGPLVLEDNSLCYYRIKATVKGSPHPKINFSKDDSSGAWGENIVQINLAPDETYELAVKASNSSGQANASAILSWKESFIKTGQSNIISDEANPANYLIEVNLNEQKVIVFYKGSLLKELVCSSGAPVTPTPKGTFKTSDKIKYAWLAQYDVGAYYFVRFYGSYLFHSTPYDKQGNLIEKEQQNLGTPVSHGCIRTDLSDAKWLYETVPSGVTVKIY